MTVPGGHQLWAHDHVVAVEQRPVRRDQPPLGFEPVPEPGSGQRRLDHHLDGVDARPAGEVRRVPRAAAGVGVQAEHEHPVHGDAVAVESGHGPLAVRGGCLLADPRQARIADGLEAHHDRPAPGPVHKVKELVIDLTARPRPVHRVRADLREPLRGQPAGGHGAQQPGGAGLVHHEVVVVEEDPVRVKAGQLGEHLPGPPVPDPPGEHGGHRAELAVVRAPPLGHQRLDCHPLVPGDQRQVRRGKRLEYLLRARPTRPVVMRAAAGVPP